MQGWSITYFSEKDFKHEENEDPEFIKETVEPFLNGLPEKLDKFDK